MQKNMTKNKFLGVFLEGSHLKKKTIMTYGLRLFFFGFNVTWILYQSISGNHLIERKAF